MRAGGREALVAAGSEGGRRAQAVVAALMDVFAGAERVNARRINDPSRTVPADINVRRASGTGWERIYEVRDKPVSREDLYLLVGKCLGGAVDEAVMIAIAPSPSIGLVEEAQRWAAERGVELTVYSDWPSLVRQALHWSPGGTLTGAAAMPAQVEKRLIELEASHEALELWRTMVLPT